MITVPWKGVRQVSSDRYLTSCHQLHQYWQLCDMTLRWVTTEPECHTDLVTPHWDSWYSQVLVTSAKHDQQGTRSRYHHSQETFTPTIDDVDDILADLVTLHADVNSNIQFQLDSAKSGYGFSWSDVTNSCVHGLSYPFTATILDLDQVSSSVTNVTKQNGPGTKVHMLWCWSRHLMAWSRYQRAWCCNITY